MKMGNGPRGLCIIETVQRTTPSRALGEWVTSFVNWWSFCLSHQPRCSVSCVASVLLLARGKVSRSWLGRPDVTIRSVPDIRLGRSERPSLVHDIKPRYTVSSWHFFYKSLNRKALRTTFGGLVASHAT